MKFDPKNPVSTREKLLSNDSHYRLLLRLFFFAIYLNIPKNENNSDKWLFTSHSSYTTQLEFIDNNSQKALRFQCTFHQKLFFTAQRVHAPISL